MTEFWSLTQDHLSVYMGAYMFATLVALMFTGIPVALALGGAAVLFGGAAVALDLMQPRGFFLLANRMWGGGGPDGTGIVHNYALVVIPCFLFMGTMLERSKVAEELLYILQVLLRRVPGVLAVSVAAMGTIMAATTGIAGASVVMMTLMALPTMLARGYSPGLATGTIAASATLGILIPPSMILVILAFMLAVPAGNLFLGAVLPGLLLSGLYVTYILTVSTLRPRMAPPLPADSIRLEPSRPGRLPLCLAGLVAVAVMSYAGSRMTDEVNWILIGFFSGFAFTTVLGRIEGNTLLGGVLRGFVPPVFLIGMVLGSIFSGWTTITEAAGVGAFGAMVLAWFKGTLTREVLTGVVERTALNVAMYFFIFAGAIAFSTTFRLIGGEALIIDWIDALDLHSWHLLFLLMAVIFFMGFFFDFLEITLIILPVFSPVVRLMAPDFAGHLGLEAPVTIGETKLVEKQMIYWFAILVATNLQTSFLTPPFGFSLFYMKGVAPSAVRMQDIYRGIVPFVILQLIGLGLIVAFPDIALSLPKNLLGF